jgi:hypothetical protein
VGSPSDLRGRGSLVVCDADLRGTHVMVTDGAARHMIPHVRVADALADSEWAWVQSLPLRSERNLPLIGARALLTAFLPAPSH